MFDNPAAKHHVIYVKNRRLARSDRHLRLIKYDFGPAIFMGEEGRISRIASLLFGGYLTFASLDRGNESADGQIPVKEMKKILATFS